MVKIKKVNIGEYILPVMVINLKSKTIISIPTQIGCIIDCSFCISKKKKFIRSLTKQELILLYNEAKKEAENNDIILSFTGEGEPFLNIKQINKAIHKLENNKEITAFRVCTSGIKPKQLSKITESVKPINLQISLHSPFTEKRQEIIEKSKSVEEIMREVRVNENRYSEIAINYVMIENFNNTMSDVYKLMDIVRKDWVIKLNPLLSDKGDVEVVENKNIFFNILQENGYTVKNFSKIGSEISNKLYDQLTYEYSRAIVTT